MRTNSRFLMSVVASSLALSGCALSHAPVKEIGFTTDELGCARPALLASVNPTELKFAGATISKVVIGQVDLKSTPRVEKLVSDEVSGQAAQVYLGCRAAKESAAHAGLKYCPELELLHRELVNLMSTKPTPDQYINFSKSKTIPECAKTGATNTSAR